jgi:hypothetical protein
MNRFMQERWSWIEGTHSLRNQLLDAVSDGDLAYTPGGQAMPLGALFREVGEIQHAYLHSLKTFTQDFAFRHPHPEIANSTAQLKAWFQQLDADLQATLAAFSDADFKKIINRGGGFEVPVDLQLDIYLQALLIFAGKATVYLRALNKPLPDHVQAWIG